ncbi:poly(glycerol-phosphate) alpha-glucosyltransferase [Mumia flava]|uniref:Poly(Glycerol-phosphate) alpha-glucosyltransferase n=1 Tax=Mumia flava TaxID=1348852 RepID=A0A0B2BQS0_9ACTN|nr:glycosyltransferase [Mumia flava]PJJ58122.1 poly(glycerol-phosphate) alpha-glucosyltransferase [Mumia flava]
MSSLDLPAGTYVTLARAVNLDKGGRTGALLMRSRMLATIAGATSIVATYDDGPDYPHRRAGLTERGHLDGGVRLVNLFEDYRGRDRSAVGSGRSDLPRLSGYETVTTDHPDGSLYATHYREPGSDADVVVDYHRPDGSVFLRWPATEGQRYCLVDHDEKVVKRWRHRAGLLRHWLAELVPSGDVFVVTDSRYSMPTLLGIEDPRFHVLELFHNPHTKAPHRWDSELRNGYDDILDRVAEMDGLVLLTARQRADVARRFGDTENLFNVANPVVLPELPDPLPERETARFVMVTRLERQKRVAFALRAVARARRDEPGIRLDVYGDGSMRPFLEKRVRELDLTETVTFHGYDPAARDRVQTATAYLMTSNFEGYPLATLEAMSRGCPVISFDITYGPREQITDGVDGFLVDDEDVEAVAERMVRLVRDPSLAAKLSDGAYQKAAAHDPESFVREWAQVFRTVKAQKARRTRLGAARLRRARLRREDAGTWSYRARLTLAGSGPAPTADGSSVTLDVFGHDDGQVVSIPLVEPDGRRTLRLRGRLAVDELAAQLGTQPVTVRVTAVWHNSSWRSVIAHGRLTDAGLELVEGEPPDGPEGAAAVGS